MEELELQLVQVVVFDLTVILKVQSLEERVDNMEVVLKTRQQGLMEPLQVILLEITVEQAGQVEMIMVEMDNPQELAEQQE